MFACASTLTHALYITYMHLHNLILAHTHTYTNICAAHYRLMEHRSYSERIVNESIVSFKARQLMYSLYELNSYKYIDITNLHKARIAI